MKAASANAGAAFLWHFLKWGFMLKRLKITTAVSKGCGICLK